MSLKLCSVSQKILTKKHQEENKWINILKMDKNKCPKLKSTENILPKNTYFVFSYHNAVISNFLRQNSLPSFFKWTDQLGHFFWTFFTEMLINAN